MFNKLEIDVDKIQTNFCTIRRLVDSKLIFVVKGDVYGLGYELVSFIDDLVHLYAVVSLSEYEKLRKYTSKRILVLSPVAAPDLKKLPPDNQLSFSISSVDQLYYYRRNGIRGLDVQIKVNTGLNRFGFNHETNLSELLTEIESDLNFKISGFYTHLHSSTEAGVDSIRAQFDQFMEFLSRHKKFVDTNSCIHYTDSAALLKYDHLNIPNAIRTGMAVLGMNPISEQSTSLNIEFALRIVTIPVYKQIVETGCYYGYEKQSINRIYTVTIGIGYCDGMIKSWIGNYILKSPFGLLKLLDVSMNSSIVEVDSAAYDNVVLFETEFIIIESQRDVDQLALLAQTCQEDIVCGFNSTNVKKEYKVISR